MSGAAGEGEGKVVCVTGASGFIASWLVKLLLHRGYTVKATVRNLHDTRKTEHLLALDGAKERLYLFEANLIEEGSFDSVIDGCCGVFHTASPVFFSVADPQRELIDPAVKGTLNVLKSCAKVPSIKRVIVTSSMASVACNSTPLTPGVLVDETWFSDLVHCEQSKGSVWQPTYLKQPFSSIRGLGQMYKVHSKDDKLWYPVAKMLAEDAALNFSKENGIDLVTLHPCTAIGPLLQPILNLSSELMLNFIKNGKESVSNESYRYVDVRDVAWAHIFAFEIPSASGRYCLVGNVLYSSEVARILNKLYPALNLFERFEDDELLLPPYEVSKERAKSLGVNFTPFEVSVMDTVESLREKKFLSL